MRLLDSTCLTWLPLALLAAVPARADWWRAVPNHDVLSRQIDPTQDDATADRLAQRDDHLLGLALFLKDWRPDEPSRHGGDGLGPYFNRRSCLACHHQGAVGGAGKPTVTNLHLDAIDLLPKWAGAGETFARSPETFHPALRGEGTIVLQEFVLAPAVAWPRDDRLAFRWVSHRLQDYDVWTSQQQSPSLLGSGRIDAIPESALIDAAGRAQFRFPEVTGRVHRLADGRIGRFGWKAGVARLDEFVSLACANELGLEVPGRHQADLAPEAERTARDLDMDRVELEALSRFVAALPAPRESRANRHLAGRALFEQVGCVSCHPRTLGGVEGIYSDLLLHDIGPSAGTPRDANGWESKSERYGIGGLSYSFSISKAGVSVRMGDSDPSAPESESESNSAPRPNEWRTPPLWGVRASAPYWHDGSAPTLEAAIKAHGGEATPTRKRFLKLPSYAQKSLIHFVATLGVPPKQGVGLRGDRR